MLFNPKAIGKMKMAELEDTIKVYEENIEEVQVVELANNNERMSFLEALVKEHGVPAVATKETEEATKGDVKEGDVVFISAEEVEEGEVRAEMMAQVTELTKEMPEEEKANYLAEAEKLETAALGELVNKLIADKDAAEGSEEGDDDGDDKDTEEEEENTTEDNSEASEGSEKEEEDDNVAEKLGEAIENGEMRWEGRLITGFRNKPLSGQIFFELFGNDNATYLASRSDLVKHFGIKDEA